MNLEQILPTPLLEGREASIIASRPVQRRGTSRSQSRTPARSSRAPSSQSQSQAEDRDANNANRELSRVEEEEDLLEQLEGNGVEEESQTKDGQIESENLEEETGTKTKSKKKTTKKDLQGSGSDPFIFRKSWGQLKTPDVTRLQYTIAALYFTLIIARVPVIFGDLLE